MSNEKLPEDASAESFVDWHQHDRARQCRRKWYTEYLQTDAWKERRRLVLQRTGGLCEGCRQEPASEVHHLSYNHVGNEFLWELVAICRWCHARYHEVRHD
jgi:hypothetical protein